MEFISTFDGTVFNSRGERDAYDILVSFDALIGHVTFLDNGYNIMTKQFVEWEKIAERLPNGKDLFDTTFYEDFCEKIGYIYLGYPTTDVLEALRTLCIVDPTDQIIPIENLKDYTILKQYVTPYAEDMGYQWLNISEYARELASVDWARDIKKGL